MLPRSLANVLQIAVLLGGERLRWGDYVSVRRNSPSTLLFDASGYAVLKRTPPATGFRFDPYYIQFGRDSVVNGGSVIK